MRRLAQEVGARGFVVGLSGGVDSAGVARLAQLALPGAGRGVIMPCHSHPQDEADARLVRTISPPAVRVDLAPAHDAFLADARAAMAAHGGPEPGDEADARARLALANVKPRLRMTALYFVANSLNYLVAGTSNRSEIAIGYYTKYGDGAWTAAARPAAQGRSAPCASSACRSQIEKALPAGLFAWQTDEGEMGFTYEELERFLTQGSNVVPPQVAARIAQLARASDHKRELPPMPDEEKRLQDRRIAYFRIAPAEDWARVTPPAIPLEILKSAIPPIPPHVIRSQTPNGRFVDLRLGLTPCRAGAARRARFPARADRRMAQRSARVQSLDLQVADGVGRTTSTTSPRCRAGRPGPARPIPPAR
jgi:NAD+ synthase